MPHHITEETLAMAQGILATGPRSFRTGEPPPPGMKAIDIATGLYGYSLEAPAKKLYPVEDGMRRRIPRWRNPVGAPFTHWKKIVGINKKKLRAGVPEGMVNKYIQLDTKEAFAKYKTLNMAGNLSQEAQVFSRQFEDSTALNMLTALQSLMEQEDISIIGGCWTSLNPAMQAATVDVTNGDGSTGDVPAGSYVVKVSALTLQGFYAEAQGRVTDDEGVTANSDGETTAKAAASFASTGGSMNVVWTDIPGAFGYNVYVNDKWAMRVSTNRATILEIPADGTPPNTADTSVDDLGYQGIMEQLLIPGSNAYYKSMEGGTLTSDGAGGIKEIEDMFARIWDNWASGPTVIVCNSQEQQTIKKLTIGSSSVNASRVIISTGEKDDFKAGAAVSAYLNQNTNQFVKIMNSRHMPPGRMMLLGENVPYANSEVPNNFEIDLQMEYFGRERPQIDRSQSVDVTCIGAVKVYLGGICGVLTNVGA